MLDSTRHNSQIFSYQIELKKEEYLISSFLGNTFTTNIKRNNKDNITITTIERLFLNTGYRSCYKRLTEKARYETCKFFMHFVRCVRFKDQVAFC